MSQNKLRVKGVNSGGGTPQGAQYYIDTTGGLAGNYIRYNTNESQILTNSLSFAVEFDGSYHPILSLVEYQLIRITQVNNPSIYQQFRVMGIPNEQMDYQITYTVVFDEFTITDFQHEEPVIVTVIN